MVDVSMAMLEHHHHHHHHHHPYRRFGSSPKALAGVSVPVDARDRFTAMSNMPWCLVVVFCGKEAGAQRGEFR